MTAPVGVDVDATVASMLDLPASQHAAAGNGDEPFDAAALTAATAVLVQMRVAMRLTPNDEVVGTVGDIYERAKTMCDVPAAVGLAASLVDQVRDEDHPAVAGTLLDGYGTFGGAAVLTALGALIASFTIYLADALELDRADAFDAVREHRRTLGAERYRNFCLAHRRR